MLSLIEPSIVAERLVGGPPSPNGGSTCQTKLLWSAWEFAKVEPVGEVTSVANATMFAWLAMLPTSWLTPTMPWLLLIESVMEADLKINIAVLAPFWPLKKFVAIAPRVEPKALSRKLALPTANETMLFEFVTLATAFACAAPTRSDRLNTTLITASLVFARLSLTLIVSVLSIVAVTKTSAIAPVAGRSPRASPTAVVASSFFMADPPPYWGTMTAENETMLAWLAMLPAAWFTPTMPVLPLIDPMIDAVLLTPTPSPTTDSPTTCWPSDSRDTLV